MPPSELPLYFLQFSNGTFHSLECNRSAWVYLSLAGWKSLHGRSEVCVIFMSTAEPGAWQGHVLCWMTFAQNKPVLLLLFPFHHSSFPHTPLDGGHPLRSHAHPFLLMPVESHIFKEAMLPTPAPMAASPSFLLHSLSAWSWSHRIQPLGPSWLIWCFPGRLEVSCDGTEMSVPSVTHWPLNSLRAWTWSVLFTSAFPA